MQTNYEKVAKFSSWSHIIHQWKTTKNENISYKAFRPILMQVCKFWFILCNIRFACIGTILFWLSQLLCTVIQLLCTVCRDGQDLCCLRLDVAIRRRRRRVGGSCGRRQLLLPRSIRCCRRWNWKKEINQMFYGETFNRYKTNFLKIIV